MTNTILQYLDELDLSETEAQLYLKLLETGQISVRDLAQTTGLKRTTAYLHVDLLVEKGLVMKIVKGSQKQVAANPPAESLEYLVTKKLETATAMKSKFPIMIQELTKSIPQGTEIGNAEIKYYKGKSGIRKIYEEALHAQELKSYVNIAIISELMPENSILFSDALTNTHGPEIYEIIDGSNRSKEYVKKYNEYSRYHYKFLPENIKLSTADTLVYDDKVAIINVSEKMTGVIFKNNDYYNNSRELFDFVWNMLPEIS